MPEPQFTRWSLVLGAAGGDAERREAFANQYAPVLRAYFAARWRVPAEHERVVDATQEVFVQCFKQGGVLERVDPEREGGFRAFLFGTAGNVALMAERKFARQRARESGTSSFDPDEVARNQATLSQTFDKAWATMVAREARRRLARRATGGGRHAERFRCLELQYAQGLPPREIAERLGLPVTGVYERLREARSAFKETLLEVVGEQHPGRSKAELEDACKELVALL